MLAIDNFIAHLFFFFFADRFYLLQFGCQTRLTEATHDLPKIAKVRFLTSFDPLNIDPVTPNFHHNVFLCGPTHLPNLVFLAHVGAEIAGGQLYALPPPPPGGRWLVEPPPAGLI